MCRTSAILLLASVLFAPALGAQEECEPCSREAQLAEYQQILELYRVAVAAARASGFQCYADEDYHDPGAGEHRAGNCADWQAVTWGALITRQWDCWTITRIRARKKFTLFPRIYHHFVSLTPKCGGTRIYFDPWVTGTAAAADEDNFTFANGFWSWWIHYPQDTHDAGTPGRTP
ncbi:MAG: hypothetical protein IH968_13985 [Gemmatimonadetes bacterium]|nr:hypothetical protein [Gemmatimonadota bacterium]